MDLARIIAGCKNGDRLAQKAIFEAYAFGMQSLCKRYVTNERDAEELTLNGFYKFFTSIDRFEYQNPARFVSWLKRIMINECLMFLRQNKEVVFSEQYAAEVTIDGEILEKMNVDTILKLIASLPDGYRIVFNMYVIEGYEHREIAELLKISEGTSRSQLSRAKQHLQKLLAEKEAVYEKG